jgi:uncharacterized protein (DUF2267 family)
MFFPDFLNQLVEHGRFAGAEDAQRALTTALEALGYLLPARLVRELEAALPAQCTRSLRFGESVSASRREREPAIGERAPGVLSGATLERVQEVCAVLAATLPPALVESVARELPAQLSEAFEPRGLPGLTPRRRGLEPTLAGGRSGALHPISEAQTGSAHALSSSRPRPAQQGSLDEANPHGDSKLSSARGTTQEREHETLAEGRPRR